MKFFVTNDDGFGGTFLGELVAPLRNAGRTLAIAGLCLLSVHAFGAEAMLPGTHPLIIDGDLSAQMVEGMARYLDRETAAAAQNRAQFWHSDTSSRPAYERSVQPNREHFTRIIGAVDARLAPAEMEYVASVAVPAKVAETDRFVAYAVRWPVFDGVYGEGLLLQPKGRVVARVVAVPDADQTPETIAGLLQAIPASDKLFTTAYGGYDIRHVSLRDPQAALKLPAAESPGSSGPYRQNGERH